MEFLALLGVLTHIYQEYTIIDELNKCFNFDHHFILAESSEYLTRFVSKGNQPRSLSIFKRTNGSNVRGLEGIPVMETKNTFMVVVPDSSMLNKNLHLLEHIRDVQRLNRNTKIGIFFQSVTMFDDIRNHFMWFRNQSVVNVFAAIYPSEAKHFLNIFTFHSFGNFEVLNVTNRNLCEEIFPSLDFNYHKHQFKVAPNLRGFQESFWLSIFHSMNATFTITEGDIYEIFGKYFQNGADIISLLDSLSVHSNDGFHMYPLALTHMNIVVPEAEPYTGFYVYIRTLTTDVFFAYCTGAIAAVVATLSGCRYFKEKKFLFLQSLRDVMKLLVGENSHINYRCLSRAEAFVIGALTFVGFVVVNGYFSSLESYLAKPILRPQLRTVSDIYKSPLSIVTSLRHEQHVLERISYRLSREKWASKIVTIETENLLTQYYSFNTSTSYVISDHDYDTVLSVERMLNIRGFYDTGVTVSTSLCIFPVSTGLAFFDRLNENIHWRHSTGLLQLWWEKASEMAKKEILKINLHRKKQQQEDEEFEFPTFIIFGWIVSTVVFFIEICWARCRSHVNGYRIRRFNRRNKIRGRPAWISNFS